MALAREILEIRSGLASAVGDGVVTPQQARDAFALLTDAEATREVKTDDALDRALRGASLTVVRKRDMDSFIGEVRKNGTALLTFNQRPPLGTG